VAKVIIYAVVNPEKISWGSARALRELNFRLMSFLLSGKIPQRDL
jgi:hypothetical protein